MRMLFGQDDEGVSVVIGTILMVLLTIVLVSALMYYVMTFIDDLPDNPVGKDGEDPGGDTRDLSHNDEPTFIPVSTETEPFSLY